MARTAGEGWVAVLTLSALVLGAQGLGCGPSEGTDAPADNAISEATRAYLARVGPGVILPALNAFRSEAVPLRAAIDSWQAAVGTEGENDAREAAREAFAAAFEAWQLVEPMQVGALAPSLSAPGGRDLRDTAYSWPTVNPCRVDQETVAGDFESAAWTDTALVNVRGLDALEYLLHVDTPANACPPQVNINSDGSWDALGDEVWQARADYAAALASDLIATTDAAISAWSPSGDDQSGGLATPGAGPWSTEAQALNAVYDALFYMYKKGNDRKIGQPAGIIDCGAATCPDDVEARRSGLSDRAFLANLRGFRALFSGDFGDDAGPGMDDVLIAAGAEDVAEQVLSTLQIAEDAVEALDQPFDEAIAADADAFRDLYRTVKDFADVVRHDVSTVLQLTVPQEAAGDND